LSDIDRLVCASNRAQADQQDLLAPAMRFANRRNAQKEQHVDRQDISGWQSISTLAERRPGIGEKSGTFATPLSNTQREAGEEQQEKPGVYCV
jgi:hypothetical protein